ncbi:MAG TPA: LCP family protein [Nocardioidaceae bacterium]|nr:LCP family protein [Nocardioidaceae bacterium]
MPSANALGPHDRLARLRFRRAVTLMLMTLVVPGSAQLVAGRKQVGRIALRTWLGLLGALLLVALLGLVWPGFVFWLLSNSFMVGVIRLVLFVLAIGWAGLFVDAWRLGRPLELQQRQRLAMVGLNGVLCFAVAGTLLFASHTVGVAGGFITAMFGHGKVSDSTDGRYNVLLLGGDSGDDRWGLRPDSITVASIDEGTGRTILFGLPRNMQDFPFPEGSVMHEQYPDGYDCDDCYLNSLSTFAADNEELFTEYVDPGVEATIEGVEGITGLDINYYAMVNLKGFRDLVDAVGGVELNVRDRIPIGGVGAPITGYIEPGVKRLDGFETLWFARSRSGADDYSRMARQKCVMNAMLDQLSPQVVVTRFSEIAEASKQVISTDLPASELDRFIALALKAKAQPVATVSFVPPLVNTAEPDIELIQDRVQQAIDKSQGREDGETVSAEKKVRRPAAGGGAASAPTTGGSIGSLAEGYAANDATDLSSAC